MLKNILAFITFMLAIAMFSQQKQTYVCPLCDNICDTKILKKEGKCTICNMDLITKEIMI